MKSIAACAMRQLVSKQSNVFCRFRIKDPQRSLDFYTRVLGLTLLEKLDFADAKFSLLFLGQYAKKDIPEDPSERVRATCLRHCTVWSLLPILGRPLKD